MAKIKHIISLKNNETFNIGYRRFIVIDVEPEKGCKIKELGGESFSIVPGSTVAVGKATLREGSRTSASITELDIVCDEVTPIWCGLYKMPSDVELLAPVPLEHLESALEVQENQGRVAFGSSAWQVFSNLDNSLEGQPCTCHIYASGGSVSSAPKINWKATYLRHLESRMGAHPGGIAFRPNSTLKYPSDNIGHWAVFWEVTDLQKIKKDQEVPIGQFRGLGKRANYKTTFRPEGPMLVEPY